MHEDVKSFKQLHFTCAGLFYSNIMNFLRWMFKTEVPDYANTDLVIDVSVHGMIIDQLKPVIFKISSFLFKAGFTTAKFNLNI